MNAQAEAALSLANVRRREVRDVRHAVRADPSTFRSIVLNPPECLAEKPLIDVVRLVMLDRRGGPGELVRLGRFALRDGVNLLLPIERASLARRRWLADAVSWEWQGRGLVLRVVDPSSASHKEATAA